MKKHFGIEDVFIFGGLAILTVGLWLFSISLALTVCGSILLAFGIYSSIPRRK